MDGPRSGVQDLLPPSSQSLRPELAESPVLVRRRLRASCQGIRRAAWQHRWSTCYSAIYGFINSASEELPFRLELIVPVVPSYAKPSGDSVAFEASFLL